MTVIVSCTEQPKEDAVYKASHSFDKFTTTIEMHKFYATYPYIVNN